MQLKQFNVIMQVLPKHQIKCYFLHDFVFHRQRQYADLFLENAIIESILNFFKQINKIHIYYKKQDLT